VKFALSYAQKDDHEGQTVHVYCVLNGIEYRVFQRPKDVPPDYIPVGNVPWVSDVLGRVETPDYYPEFLQPWLRRKVWRADKWPYGHRVFIKPADRHKRFTGFVTTGTWKGKRKPPYWCSEIVRFVSEWRWYVAGGQVYDAKWGSGEEAPVPDLKIDWPADYYAAVDFGLLDSGQIALIESNSPFACGWYGRVDEGETYVRWLAASWAHLAGRQPELTPKSG
jgi:hypothetical protein